MMTSIGIRIGGGVALVVALLAGYVVWHHKVYKEGREYERTRIVADIERTQVEEIERAQKARADADGAVVASGSAGLQHDPFNRDNHCADPQGNQCVDQAR